MTDPRPHRRGTTRGTDPRQGRTRATPDSASPPTRRDGTPDSTPPPARAAAQAHRAATRDTAPPPTPGVTQARRDATPDTAPPPTPGVTQARRDATPDTAPPPARSAAAPAGSAPLAGRRAQAARNDAVILAAARDVFLDDPKAPVAAVAERAGVGMSALYRRYPGKQDLLRQLCHDGLRRFNAEAESAAEEPDGWTALTTFLSAVVDADVHSLTVHLAGTFTPTPEMRADAQRSGVLVAELVRRAHESGTLRRDVVAEDIGLVLESCAAIRVPDPERTKQLRRRHLRLLLDGLAVRQAEQAGRAGQPGRVGRAGRAGRAGRPTHEATPLPGPPPAADELNWRWRRRPAS